MNNERAFVSAWTFRSTYPFPLHSPGKTSSDANGLPLKSTCGICKRHSVTVPFTLADSTESAEHASLFRLAEGPKELVQFRYRLARTLEADIYDCRH